MVGQGRVDGQGGVGSAMGGVRWFGPIGRDQAYVPQGEPTFPEGWWCSGRGKSAVFQGLVLVG